MAVKKHHIGNVRDLKVYRKALLFCKMVYEIIKTFPEHENDNLCNLLRKSSCSVASNISEGNTNFYYKKEYHHLNMTISKLAETRTGLDIAKMQGFINDLVYKDADRKAEEILKMIIGMMKRIEGHLSQEIQDEKDDVVINETITDEVKELIEKASAYHKLILSIVVQYPQAEKYNQKDQIIRASQSILKNLQSSLKNSSEQQFLNLNTVLGSISECRAFQDMAIMGNFISTEQYKKLDDISEQILCRLIETMSHWKGYTEVAE